MRKYFCIKVPATLLAPIQNGHPWGYSKKFEPYLRECKSKQFVKIKTLDDKFVALAFYTPNELVSLKVFWYKEEFQTNEFYEFLKQVLQKRKPLFQITNSIRLVHGENDGIPSITIDLHNITLVVRVYSPSLVYFARYVQILVRKILKTEFGIHIQNVLLQKPNRHSHTFDSQTSIRVWYGSLPHRIQIHQNGIEYFINTLDQKGGIYNDIRNLRSFILNHPNLFSKEPALNLFSNNGFLSKILEKVGISKIYSLEDSQKSILVAKENLDPKFHEIVKLDIFKELKFYLKSLQVQFGTIIIDPPSLTASNKDKIKARKIYSELIRTTIPYLKPNGIFILCSCSNRIHEQDFERISKEEFVRSQVKMKQIAKLPPELDHPTKKTFPEGNYFKVHIYQRKLE